MASVAVPAGPTSSHPSPADCHRPVWWKALQLLPTVHGAVALVPICWRWGAGLGTGECLPCQLSQSCAHLFYNSTGDIGTKLGNGGQCREPCPGSLPRSLTTHAWESMRHVQVGGTTRQCSDLGHTTIQV